jgi:hypothetical protein
LFCALADHFSLRDALCCFNARNSKSPQAMGKKSKDKKPSSTNDRSSALPDVSEELRSLPMSWQSTGAVVRESEGRRMYELLGLLGAIVLPEMNAHLAKYGKPPLSWDPFNAAANSDHLVRAKVNKYVIAEIARLTAEVQSGQHNAKARTILGRQLTAVDHETIRGFSAHVEADFFVVGLVRDGAVLVQVPRRTSSNSSISALNEPTQNEEEVRVFVVRGLADPLERLLQPLMQEARGLGMKGADGKALKYALIHTVLFSLGDCITYMSTFSPSIESFSTAKQEDDAVSMATKAYQKAQESGRRIYRTLDVTRDASVLTGVSHSDISHVLGDAANQKAAAQQQPSTASSATTTPRQSATTAGALLPVQTHMILWQPVKDMGRPDSDKLIAFHCENRPLPPMPTDMNAENAGFKSTMVQQQEICGDLNEACPLCFPRPASDPKIPLNNSKKVRMFKHCCYPAFSARREQSAGGGLQGRGGGGSITSDPSLLFYDPIDEVEEASALMARLHTAAQAGQRYNAWGKLRRSFHEAQKVTVAMDPCKPEALLEVDRRLKHSFLFHCAGPTDASGDEEMYDYLGHFPFSYPGMGLLCFGSLSFNKSNGRLEVCCLTSRRMSAVIKAVFRHACASAWEFEGDCPGILHGLEHAFIAPPSVVATPSRKVKADKFALEKNRALLESFLAKPGTTTSSSSTTSTTSSSAEPSSAVPSSPEAFVEKDKTRRCSYCQKEASDPSQRLKKCSRCGVAAYCGPACQKSHWPHHKARCKSKS